jgi:hypothetical protein
VRLSRGSMTGRAKVFVVLRLERESFWSAVFGVLRLERDFSDLRCSVLVLV